MATIYRDRKYGDVCKNEFQCISLVLVHLTGSTASNKRLAVCYKCVGFKSPPTLSSSVQKLGRKGLQKLGQVERQVKDSHYKQDLSESQKKDILGPWALLKKTRRGSL